MIECYRQESPRDLSQTQKILIHELLHLKMSFWCQNDDNVEDRVMHQIIDDLARAFVEKEG